MNTAELRPGYRPVVPHPSPSRDQRAKLPRLLYVDQNMETLVAFTVLLAMSGYVPLSTQDPIAALGLAKSTPLNLAVLNYDLPRMNGFELAREIRQAKPGLPIVLLTDNDSATEDSAAIVDYCLPKAGNLNDLLGRIDRWLQHRYLALGA